MSSPNRILFSSAGNTLGAELWITDGTAGGTSLLADIQAGLFGSYPGNITAFGTGALFTANDGTHGRELWRTDGRPAAPRW